jgi:hypothetical protein
MKYQRMLLSAAHRCLIETQSAPPISLVIVTCMSSRYVGSLQVRFMKIAERKMTKIKTVATIAIAATSLSRPSATDEAKSTILLVRGALADSSR